MIDNDCYKVMSSDLMFKFLVPKICINYIHVWGLKFNSSSKLIVINKNDEELEKEEDTEEENDSVDQVSLIYYRCLAHMYM